MANNIVIDRGAFRRQMWVNARQKSIDKYEKLALQASSPQDQQKISVDGAKQMIIYSIKVFGGYGRLDWDNASGEALEYHWLAMEAVIRELKRFTYEEFCGWFPIKKKYDGEHWGMKDYFSVMEYINLFGKNELIHDPLELLMEYSNFEVQLFIANLMLLMSEITRRNTGVGILEAFLAENNMMGEG